MSDQLILARLRLEQTTRQREHAERQARVNPWRQSERDYLRRAQAAEARARMAVLELEGQGTLKLVA